MNAHLTLARVAIQLLCARECVCVCTVISLKSATNYNNNHLCKDNCLLVPAPSHSVLTARGPGKTGPGMVFCVAVVCCALALCSKQSI